MTAGMIQEATHFIEDWVPRKEYHIEARYLDDLKMQLQRKFVVKQPFMAAARKASVIIEDGKGLDMGIKRKVGQEEESLGIIFKKDLQQLGELRRLISQIEEYERRFKNTVIILLGAPDSDIKEKLNAFLSGRGAGKSVTVISK